MQQTTKIATNVLKVHPRNQEFFDDIEGIDYEQFRDSIARNGYVHTPLIVTPDMTVVSGHQRLKACIEVGIDKVDVIIRDDINSEDDKLKVLLETNFMRQKNNHAKQVKVASEYVGLVGAKQGGQSKQSLIDCLKLEDIARQLGTSETSLKELLLIDRKLSHEIRGMFDDGKITKTTAVKVWCKLSKEDQEKLFFEIGKDKIAKMTQAETQKYINKVEQLQKLNRQSEEEKRKLQQDLQREKNNVKTDHKTLERNKQLEQIKSDLENKNKNLESTLKMKEQLLENYKVDSEEYRKLKSQMSRIQVERDSYSRQTEAAIKITELVSEVDYLLQNKLAPVKYKDFMFVLNDNSVVADNFIHIIDLVGNWYDEMKLYISQNNNENIITVEVN